MRAGPIDLGMVAGEYFLPVHPLPRRDPLPAVNLLRVHEQFFHVVAGAECQLFQGRLSDIVPVRPKPEPMIFSAMVGSSCPAWTMPRAYRAAASDQTEVSTPAQIGVHFAGMKCKRRPARISRAVPTRFERRTDAPLPKPQPEPTAPP